MGQGVRFFMSEVLVSEIADILYFRIELHSWEFARCTLQLCPHLIEMVVVYMCVTECVDEFTWFESGHLCHHHEQQGI